jgi:hypothetical protein
MRRREKCNLAEPYKALQAPELEQKWAANEDWATEIFLMHHYTTSTAPSFSADEAIQNAFQIEVPQLGQKHPFLLSALVASAALHIHESHPLDKPKYWMMFKKHQGLVLSALQQQLQNVTEETCTAVFACASLVGFFMIKEFSMDNSTITDKMTACARLAQNLKMVHGAKVAVGGFRFAVYASPLGIALFGKGCKIGHALHFSKSTESALGDLQMAIASSADLKIRTLQEAFCLLKVIYWEVANTMPGSSIEINQLCKFNALVSWDYISMVQKGNNFAVVIFAYFSVLSAAVHKTWCMNKMYGKMVLKYARYIVDGSFQYLLDWPEQQCENNLEGLLE